MLNETIKSILDQDCIQIDELEYIVWYSGPSDPRFERVIEPYRDRIKLIYGHDSGLYDSLGQIFPLVSGDIVSYLNVGDLWSNRTARIVLDSFRSHPAISWLCGLQTVYNRGGSIVSTRLPFRFRSKFIRSGMYGKSRCLPVIQQESSFWRRNLLQTLDFDFFRGLLRAGDAYMWKCFAQKEELYVIRAALGGFREHDNHLAGGYDKYQAERVVFNDSFRIRWLPVLLFDKVMWRAIDSRKIHASKGYILEA